MTAAAGSFANSFLSCEKAPLFSKKERKLYTLLALNLYGPAWCVHCFVKNRK